MRHTRYFLLRYKEDGSRKRGGQFTAMRADVEEKVVGMQVQEHGKKLPTEYRGMVFGLGQCVHLEAILDGDAVHPGHLMLEEALAYHN